MRFCKHGHEPCVSHLEPPRCVTLVVVSEVATFGEISFTSFGVLWFSQQFSEACYQKQRDTDLCASLCELSQF
jgi:hypothetical protein